jgi:hypothetical protein
MSALGWVLGTFHAAAFALAFLLLVYPRGGLGAPFLDIGALNGLAVFIALWMTTLFTTSRAIAGIDLLGERRAGFHLRALRWGGANGMLFYGCLAALVVVNAILSGAPAASAGELLSAAALYASWPLAIALVIGALSGVILATLDLAALRLARAGAPPG